jgi:hypothetical protein
MIAPTPLTQVMIRFSERGDERELARLAGRDSRSVPAGELLVAEADGEIRAALPVDGEDPVADPFHPTAELVHMLELRRSQLRAACPRRVRRRRPLARIRLLPAVVGRLARR